MSHPITRPTGTATWSTDPEDETAHSDRGRRERAATKIVPGFRSSRIHVVNVADDPRRPRIEKVIEPEELVAKTGYARPHTVHCMPGQQRRRQHARRRAGQRRGRHRRHRRADVRSEGPLGERHVNLHTSVNPGGALREQIHNPKKR